MKIKDIKKEIKSKSKADLDKLLAEKMVALRASRFEAAGSKSRNVKEARNTRRDIARIKTELRIKK